MKSRNTAFIPDPGDEKERRIIWLNKLRKYNPKLPWDTCTCSKQHAVTSKTCAICLPYACDDVCPNCQAAIKPLAPHDSDEILFSQCKNCGTLKGHCLPGCNVHGDEPADYDLVDRIPKNKRRFVQETVIPKHEPPKEYKGLRYYRPDKEKPTCAGPFDVCGEKQFEPSVKGSCNEKNNESYFMSSVNY